MKHIFERIKNKVKKHDEEEEDFVEVKPNLSERDDKLYVRPFVLEDFSDLKPILDYLREGNSICLVNIKPMREKDLLELKRAVKKFKTTVEAINGDIRGFGEDHLIIVPNYVDIAAHKIETPKDDIEIKPYFDE